MIGLGKFPPSDRGAFAYWPLLERATAVLPRDRTGRLDMQPAAGLTIPSVIEGATGPARAFLGGDGLQAESGLADAILGPVSVLGIVRIDSGSAGSVGTLVAHQDATGATGAWGVLLESLGGAQVRATLRFTSGGTPVSVQATVGVDADWHVWAFTRISTADGLVWRVWVDGELAGETTAADASPDRPATGLVTVGHRLDGLSAPTDQLVADVGPLQVYDRELAREEVQLLYQSLSTDVAVAHRLVQALEPVHVDGGGIWSLDDGAWVRREIRIECDLWAVQLGQLRSVSDELPDRCYGEALERWEHVLDVAATGTVEARRARVLTAIRRVSDFTEAEYQSIFAPVLDTDASNIELLQNSNAYRYAAAELVSQPSTWIHVTGSSGNGSISYPGYLRLDNPSGTARDWPHNPLGIRWHVSGSSGSSPFEFRVRVCDWTTGIDVYQGLMVSDQFGRAVFFGRKNTELLADLWDGGAWTGETVLGSNPINNDVLTLTGDENGNIKGALDSDFSTLTSVGTLAVPGFLSGHLQVWILGFTKGVGVWPSGALAFLCADDVRAVWRNGLEPYFAAVYRDPLLPGSPDYFAADGIMQSRKPAWMNVRVTSADALYADDPNALVEYAPMV